MSALSLSSLTPNQSHGNPGPSLSTRTSYLIQLPSGKVSQDPLQPVPSESGSGPSFSLSRKRVTVLGNYLDMDTPEVALQADRIGVAIGDTVQRIMGMSEAAKGKDSEGQAEVVNLGSRFRSLSRLEYDDSPYPEMDYPEVGFGQFIEHLQHHVHSFIPEQHRAAYVAAVSPGQPQEELARRLQMLNDSMEKREHFGYNGTRELHLLLAAVVMLMVPQTKRGVKPATLEAIRIDLACTLFCMAFRSLLEGGKFVLTVDCLMRATGYLDRHKSGKASFLKTIMTKARDAFNPVTDEAGNVLKVYDKTYLWQRHGMTLYDRGEIGQALVEALGPLPEGVTENQPDPDRFSLQWTPAEKAIYLPQREQQRAEATQAAEQHDDLPEWLKRDSAADRQPLPKWLLESHKLDETEEPDIGPCRYWLETG